MFFEGGDEPDAHPVERFGEGLADVTLVGEEQAGQTLAHLGDGFAVVGVAGRELDADQLAPAVDDGAPL